MKISIVITAYNVERFLQKAVESCINQDYEDLEIIIVEDCSTDNTLSLCKELKEKDSRIRLLKNIKNVGAGESRYIGSINATGEYIQFLDGDDWFIGNSISLLANKAKETNADIVGGGVSIFKENGLQEITVYPNITLEGNDKILKYWGKYTFWMNSKIVRRTLFDKVPYCKRRYIEDTPTIIPQTHFANKVVYIEDIVYGYRMHDKSLTHTADIFKNALYTALTGFEIIEFFKIHNPKILEDNGILNSLLLEIKKIQQVNLTKEMVEQYKDDYIDFTIKLLKFQK